MPDPTGIYNDGNIPYGSQVVTIATKDYIMSSGSLETGSNQVVSNNEVGVPRGQVFSTTIPSGSAELQFADAAQLPPAQFETFTLTTQGTGATVLVVITKVGQTWSQGDEKKCSIDISKVLNPPGSPE